MRTSRRRAGRWFPRRASSASGQGLVEFALVMPIFITLLMAIIEFGFLYNSMLTIQYAARQGVTAAAQVGSGDGADCSILKAVELALTLPINRDDVDTVDIFLSDANGDVVSGSLNRYARTGTLDCPGTGTQPYTLVGTEGYSQTERNETLADGLDIIGVRINYQYVGITPVGAGRTWALSDRATLRVEPKQ